MTSAHASKHSYYISLPLPFTAPHTNNTHLPPWFFLLVFSKYHLYLKRQICPVLCCVLQQMCPTLLQYFANFAQVHLFPSSCRRLTWANSYEACNWHQAGVISAPPYAHRLPSTERRRPYIWPCGELKTRGEAQPLSQESEIVSSALNLHFISCTDCHLPNVCVRECVCVRERACGWVRVGAHWGSVKKNRGKNEAGGKSKEERKRNKNCLSPKLCVINVKLLSLSPPLLLAPLSQTASTHDRSS